MKDTILQGNLSLDKIIFKKVNKKNFSDRESLKILANTIGDEDNPINSQIEAYISEINDIKPLTSKKYDDNLIELLSFLIEDRSDILIKVKKPSFLHVFNCDARCEVAYYNDMPVALILYTFSYKYPKSLKMEIFTVNTKFQRMGLGSLVLDHMVELAKEKNCHNIFVDAMDESIAFWNRKFRCDADFFDDIVSDFYLNKKQYDTFLNKIPGKFELVQLIPYLETFEDDQLNRIFKNNFHVAYINYLQRLLDNEISLEESKFACFDQLKKEVNYNEVSLITDNFKAYLLNNEISLSETSSQIFERITKTVLKSDSNNQVAESRDNCTVFKSSPKRFSEATEFFKQEKESKEEEFIQPDKKARLHGAYEPK